MLDLTPRGLNITGDLSLLSGTLGRPWPSKPEVCLIVKQDMSSLLHLRKWDEHSSLGSGHAGAAQAAGRLVSTRKTERLVGLSITEGGMTPMVPCVLSSSVCAHTASELDIVISQKVNSQRCGHLFGTPNLQMVEL